jgi:ParB-like chromosome segregation protein Spo0J
MQIEEIKIKQKKQRLEPKIEMLLLNNLTAYNKNSRTHSDDQVKQVAASITEFGFTVPVLIDANGEIIAGHCRTMAAKQLGLEQVPCIRLGHLTDDQKRAYVITDNNLALNAGWDEAVLALEIEGLREADFDLSLIGFSEKALLKLEQLDDLGDIPLLADDETVKTIFINCPKCGYQHAI